MDYYRQTQAVSHTGPAPQNYMYQPTSTPSNSGMYYQTMGGYTQQASPYAMQPSVSQVSGNAMVSQSGVSGVSDDNRQPRGSDVIGVMNAGVPRNQSEVPLRMIVDAKYVGAIIGQQGNKIKEITRESKAKCIVDAQKGMRDPQNSEKVILIDGTPENSTKAVVKILEVIETEKEKERDRELADGDSGLGDLEKTSEVELKLRAQNTLVGRLIGKQGATIKEIMGETETVIYVSNLPESPPTILPMYPDLHGFITERTITVKGGSIAAVSAAEQKISAKLRQSFEYDLTSWMAYRRTALQVFVKIPAMPTVLLVFDPSAKISSVKETICYRFGAAPNTQRLLHSGKQMEDDCSLSDYCLQDGSTIQVVLRMHGGVLVGEEAPGVAAAPLPGAPLSHASYLARWHPAVLLQLLQQQRNQLQAGGQAVPPAFYEHILRESERLLQLQPGQQQQPGIAAGPSNDTPAAKKAKEEDKAGKGEQKGQKGADDKTPSAPPQAKKHDYFVVTDFAGSIMGRLADVFKKAIKEAFPVVSVPLVLTEACDPKHGDFYCNTAPFIVATMKGTSKKIYEVAADIVAKLPACPLISKTEVSPAGFINVFLNEKFIEKQCGEISRKGIKMPTIKSRRVIVDFSSPNIAKEMHVGHLRSTIIGDAISRLFEAVGFDVLRLNHIDDWGTQFGMLIAHLFDRFPNFQKETPAIGDLQAFYKESKKRFDEDTEFKKRAYECVEKLQGEEPEFIKAWNDICDVSRKSNNEVYDKLDIVLKERGESYYQSRMGAIVEELTKRSFLHEEEGRHLMFPTGCDIPLTVVKSDGGFTYDTSHLAALRNRLVEENGDWLIYVVDAGQSQHFDTIFAAGRDLGWYDETVKRVEHVGFGLVLGEDKKKFETYASKPVRVRDLLTEVVWRSEKKLKEKKRDLEMTEEEFAAARDAVAYGGIKYADLSHTWTQNYVFSFYDMLDDKANNAINLLNAYARIRSIVRTSGVSQADMDKYAAENDLLPLGHPKELKLAKQVLNLSDVILQVVDTLMLHTLCDYLYTLSSTFTEFYSECYVVEKSKEGGASTVNMNRLLLAHITANTMETALKILGIRPVPKM